MLSHSINFNGYIYTLSKEPEESNDIFLKRLWYISKKNPKTVEELNKDINLSLIWRNTKFYDCTYNQEILDKL
uniref:XRN2-binding (XTBD) domain-containing protein n=1 Tax=viral metagenome TaxID=1070528 RepID=A0A6C0JC11_9ZZZZ